jgi:hypothetical protein
MAPTIPSKVGQASKGQASKTGPTSIIGKKSNLAKEERKRNATKKVQQASEKLDNLRKHHQTIRNRLKEVSKMDVPGANPEVKEQLERIKKELDDSGDALVNYEKDEQRHPRDGAG